MPTERVKIFISYSHQDTKHLKRLQVHLQSLELDGYIDPWDDKRIEIGDDWQAEIELALQTATCAILLISPDFLASKYIKNIEMPVILDRQKKQGLTILPVLVEHALLDNHPSVTRFQMVNSISKPLSLMSRNDREAAWVTLARRINELARTSPPPIRALADSTTVADLGAAPPDCNPPSHQPPPKPGEIFQGLIDVLRRDLTNNSKLAEDLQRRFDRKPLDKLIEYLVEAPCDETLPELYLWIDDRANHDSLDGVGRVANVLGVVGVKCDWVIGARSKHLRGTLSVPDIIELKSAELLVAAVKNRSARYVWSGGRFVGKDHLPISADVPAYGPLANDQALFYRSQLIAFFQLDPNGRRVDDQLYQELRACMDMKNPIYTLLDADSKLPEYLRPLTQYRWQEAWLTLRPNERHPDDEPFGRLVHAAACLGKIHSRLDELRA